MFSIGDKIVYPMHGAGVISKIEKKHVLGEDKEYFIIEMPMSEIKISVPVDMINKVGIRYVNDENIVSLVFEILKDKKSLMSTNWNKRYRDNMEKLKKGNILETAEVVRNLYLMDYEKALSTGEKKMLNAAIKILISELIIIKGYDYEEIKRKIKNIILEG